MTEKMLPEPDERFTQLILDYFAPQHLFIAEGEGARCIIELLSATPPAPGRKAIYFADTMRHQSPWLAEDVRSLDVKSVEIFSNRLELLRMMPAIFTQTSPPFRIYIAASAWFIQATETIAGRYGIGKDQIMIERCEAFSRKVCCACCERQTVAQAPDAVVCSSCGRALRITNYYSRHDHVYLGIPAESSGGERATP